MSEMSAGSVPRKEPGTGKVLGSRDRVTLGTLGGGARKQTLLKIMKDSRTYTRDMCFFSSHVLKVVWYEILALET